MQELHGVEIKNTGRGIRLWEISGHGKNIFDFNRVNIFQHFPKAIAVVVNAGDVDVGGKSPGSYRRTDANRILARDTARIVRNASPDHLGNLCQLRGNFEKLGLWGAAGGYDFNQIAEPGFRESFAYRIRR